MQGFKEILLSFSIGFAALFTYVMLHHKMQTPERVQTVDEPTASAGESVDTNLALNWGIEQVHARAAWRRHSGSKDVIVAVIDTGCDVHHPDLKDNIWRNPGENGLDDNGLPRANNGRDDDGNGFVDDAHGWDFVSQSGDVSDAHGHGTHIAGIIGAKALDGSSAIGVAPHVSLMILKYYDTDASGADNLRNTINAIRYAVTMGADIINYSGGGVIRSQEEEETLRWASKKGVLVIAAAGNEGMNSDFFHFYPADYDLPNIISVGAIDRNEELLRMSNYGASTVDVVAPGKNIYSTLPQGQHGYMSGTSQATAFVTGVAALLLANDARMKDPSLLIEHLITHSSPRLALRGRVRANGIVDAERALSASDLEMAALGNRRMPAQAN